MRYTVAHFIRQVSELMLDPHSLHMTSGTGVEGTGFNSSDAKFDFYLPTLTEQHRVTLFNN